MQQSVSHIQFRNLTIEVGCFTGNIEHAKLFISQYLSLNDFSMESHGYGYGSITIDDTKHEYTPYGIDIKMMLEWIPENFADFNPVIAVGVTAVDDNNVLNEYGASEVRSSCNII